MSIRTSPTVQASNVMPGDFIRITAANGASIVMLGGASAPLIKGAFGRVASAANGELLMNMHEMMPEEWRGYGPIGLKDGTVVERITLDDEREAAVLALQYLRNISDLVRSLAPNQDAIRPLLVAALKKEATHVADKLASSGLSVVEVVQTRSVVSKKVYLTSDPESMRNGVIPIDAISFDVAPTDTTTKVVEVHDAARAQEILFSTQRVADGASVDATDQTASRQAQPQISPFMRGLLGMPTSDVTLSAHDFGIEGDNDLDDDTSNERLIGH